MSALALPRLGSRRRRRRPLSPLGWYALLVCALSAFNIATGVMAVLDGSPLGALAVVGGATGLAVAWPVLLREIRRMDD